MMDNRTRIRGSAAVLSALSGLIWVAGCGVQGPPLAVVENVDIEQYAGKWYEIARYPNIFENGCQAATAEYALNEDGTVRVVNACFTDSLDQPRDTIEGRARVVDSETNAKLKVGFFGPFEGDYWIIDLDEDYAWAAVGEPRRNQLWILSRTPTLDESVYAGILERLEAQAYDTSRLYKNPLLENAQ